VIHCNQDDGDDEECNGGDPMFSPRQRIWGYETPDGSFAQFTRVQAQQLMPRPKHLTWEKGLLHADAGHRLPDAVRPSPHDPEAGRERAGLGRVGRPRLLCDPADQHAGANAIGVISEEDKRDFVMGLGAKGVINRKDFNCWGQMPKVNTPEYNTWLKEARKFGKAIWDDHRQGQQRRHGVRASGRGDLPGLGLRGASAAAWW
jgi:crotonyl-CoA carboxylase/reductase